MKKLLLLSWIIVCLCAAGPAQAKFHLPRKSANFTKTGKRIRNIKTPKINLPVLKPTLPPAIHKMAKLPVSVQKVTAIPPMAPIHRAVLSLRETELEFYDIPKAFTASSFIIEEEFNGQKFLWGITAAHIAYIQRGFPAVWIDDSFPYPIDFTVLGNPDMIDVAAFPLPLEDLVPDQIIPLKLADKMPQVGEKTYSFGFFNEGFFLVPNREIKEVTPNRLITSLEFDTPKRAGACGGPVLNAQGEVVGVHIGSSDSRQISFVLPSTQIKRLLKAYRNNGQDLQPLLFNGIHLGEININENIERVRTLINGEVTKEFVAKHQEKDIDYAHLETLPIEQNPDEIQLFIQHKPIAFTGPDTKDFSFQITHNFITGQTTVQPLDFIDTPPDFVARPPDAPNGKPSYGRK